MKTNNALTEEGIALALRAAIEAKHLTKEEVDKFSQALSDAAMSMGIDVEEGYVEREKRGLHLKRAERLDSLANALESAITEPKS